MKRRFLYDHGVLVGGSSLRTVTTGNLSVRANLIASTLNEAARTVDVCFATDAPILMGWWDRYYEILSFEGEDCDLSRLNAGAPMLDNHDRWGGASEQPGVVERAWVKDGKGYATLRFANDKSTQAGVADGPGEKIFQRVKDKIVRNVSVGYTVQKYTEVDAVGTVSNGMADENKVPTYRAIAWQPYEVSFAPIPADIGAGVRSEGQRSAADNDKAYQVIIDNSQNTDEMKRRFLFNAGQAGEGGNGGGAAAPAAAAPAAAPAQRAAEPPAPAAPVVRAAEPAAAASQPAPDNSAAIRSAAIMELCEIAGGYSLAEVRTLADGTETLDQIRAGIIEKKRGGQGPTQQGANPSIGMGDERRNARLLAMEDSVLHRAMPHAFPLTPGGREYRGLDLMELGRECLEISNNTTRGMSRVDVATRALNAGGTRGGMTSSSDLPIILGNVIDRVLRSAYENQDSEWRLFCRPTSFKDFRQKTVVQLSEGQDLNRVREGGEYERMALSDGKETLQVFKYGRIFAVTWETLINDDLDALGRIPSLFAEMAARKQADLVYDQLLTNPTMGDGVALFHATHANLISPGTAIGIDSMGIMRKTMRQQRGMAGKQRLNLTPKFMLVGPNYEQAALQYTSSNFVPVAQSGENPWKGVYTPIVESRITDNEWFAIADPARIDTISYGFLEGEGELITSQREGFDVDGVEVKAKMVFGAKVIEPKAFVKNPGA